MNLGVLASHDTGPIVRQWKVPVLRGDSVGDLKARVRAREKDLAVETLAGIATGAIRLAAGAVVGECCRVHGSTAIT